MEIQTCEMHTGGEPLRIVTSGYPSIKGKTILEKRQFVRENFDELRKRIMFEPRGHKDMYGALIVEADHPDADLAVLFMHNEGYSTMCGHAIIALGRYAVDQGLVKSDAACSENDSLRCVPVNIQCPCGLVKAEVEVTGNKTGRVSFVSVPAFAFATDIMVETESFGRISLDIGYGGAFYALVNVSHLKLSFNSPTERLTSAASEISEAVRKQHPVQHPTEEDLSFLYGTILTDGADMWSDEPTQNLCVFAEEAVDRSPTGSGVTARVAVMHAKRLMEMGQHRAFDNAKVHSRFYGEIASTCRCGEHDAVQVRVTGNAYYTGSSVFTVEEDDPLKDGFLINQASVNKLTN